MKTLLTRLHYWLNYTAAGFFVSLAGRFERLLVAREA